ncbi:MAG: transporter substrate-binding domain-containing protein [Propionivibrio sp.]
MAWPFRLSSNVDAASNCGFKRSQARTALTVECHRGTLRCLRPCRADERRRRRISFAGADYKVSHHRTVIETTVAVSAFSFGWTDDRCTHQFRLIFWIIQEMKPMRKMFSLLALLLMSCVATSSWAADLQEIQARGELRHLGIKYANFVTGAGDGFDVELTQGFAKHIGVKYTLVYTDFYNVLRDLLGKDVVHKGTEITLSGDYPIKGDMIATGFTKLPWREAVVLFSEPTFPSQVLLLARADSRFTPINGSGDLTKDIQETKRLIGKSSLLVMERTCLDPANYGLKGTGIDLKAYTKSTNLNEMVPALINNEAELTLLDVPDVILDLTKWAGRIKVLGPVSEQQDLAAAFPKDAPELRRAFEEYLVKIKTDGTYDKLVDKYYPGIRRYFPEFFAKKY